MSYKTSIFQAEGVYHIYNRANGQEKLFLSNANYRFFMQRYNQYLQPVLETFCYCLMPNHFHFLVRIKKEGILNHHFRKKIQNIKNHQETPSNNLDILNKLISQQFSNFFNSYTKAFNKQQKRKGNLFTHNFKRKRVNDNRYMKKLIHYIHYNPIAANLTNSYNWAYSSYPVITSEQEGKILKKEVISLFDNLENFKYCHQSHPKISGIEEL